MVGAGGIGCELLKNLVLTGFGTTGLGKITIVDLDTIDLSNLNRQFLFRHEHIKKYKADVGGSYRMLRCQLSFIQVAKEAAQSFNPNVRMEAHHKNIKDPQFNIDWFRQFDLVFNALDNLEARRHVNKMCLAADVPLIESGTTGFNGQVQVIKRGETECYDCNEKETPKTFPVCTIRSTPSQAIHCIVWAKSYLFAEIFGTSEDDSTELNLTPDAENVAEIEQLKKEAQALKHIRASMGTKEFSRRVFEKVFTEDIDRLRSMEDMWSPITLRRKPDPLNFDTITEAALANRLDGIRLEDQDQKVWTLEENFTVFQSSLKRLSDQLIRRRAEAQEGSTPPILTFDKDDKDTLDFVAAASNLRSQIFDIERKTEFDIKQMAGNIIPAIATTNAITAGLCVLQAFKVLRNDYKNARMIFLTNSADRVISSEPLSKPKPDCPVCGVCRCHLVVDLGRATLEDLVEGVLKDPLGYEDFSISSDAGGLYDPDFDDNLPKKLTELGLSIDSLLTVIDEQDEEPRVNLVLSFSAEKLPEEPNSEPTAPVQMTENVVIPKKMLPESTQTAAGQNGHSHAEQINEVAGSKRKRDATEVGLDDLQAKKKGKVTQQNGHILNGTSKDEGIMLGDDDGSGAILIDDD